MEITQGQIIPAWYGLAYRENHLDVQVCYPIPINLLVRWWHDLLWWMKRGKEDALARAYADGRTAGRKFEFDRSRNIYDTGHERGIQVGRKEYEDELYARFEKEFGHSIR